MAGKHKNALGNAIPRAVFVGISVCLQAGWIVTAALFLNEHYRWIELTSRLLSLVVILLLNSKQTNAAFKMPWIMLIMAFPVMGLSLYLLTTLFENSPRIRNHICLRRSQIRKLLPFNKKSQESLSDSGLPGAQIGRYLADRLDCPVYEETVSEYFPEAADAFAAMKRDLAGAEQFIFMEYFIVSWDASFEELFEILRGKARQGVDVRIMYDDVGSVGHTNLRFAKRLKDAGIQCVPFNPAVPVLNLFMNHRDHRKITVIDGRIGYTGGYNISDEYFGRTQPLGHWKDTGIRLEGRAVNALTAAFLEQWSISSRTAESWENYLREDNGIQSAEGFVQPYEDNPLGRERVAENVYLNLIYCARESLYIATPYLIITDEMTNALCLAAKRGVDVRIITPGIPDKKLVYEVTRSYYAALAGHGVRIYEYAPGFSHCKQILCDGMTASIGTSNLDYRSLYLHFENNVMLYGGDAVEQIGRDFRDMISRSREVSERYRTGRSRMLRMGQYILRLFAPLL